MVTSSSSKLSQDLNKLDGTVLKSSVLGKQANKLDGACSVKYNQVLYLMEITSSSRDEFLIRAVTKQNSDGVPTSAFTAVLSIVQSYTIIWSDAITYKSVSPKQNKNMSWLNGWLVLRRDVCFEVLAISGSSCPPTVLHHLAGTRYEMSTNYGLKENFQTVNNFSSRGFFFIFNIFLFKKEKHVSLSTLVTAC